MAKGHLHVFRPCMVINTQALSLITFISFIKQDNQNSKPRVLKSCICKLKINKLTIIFKEQKSKFEPTPNQSSRDYSSSDTTPIFTTNVTVVFARRFLTVIGRVDKTPDWIVASASQDLCNQEPYFTEMNQEWKLGDYQDLLLLDVGKNSCGGEVRGLSGSLTS